jgi:nucleoside-diphosphate-sugar epimerase
VLYHLTFIDDFVDGLLLCGEKAKAVGQAYIIAGEQPVTLNELAATIARALRVPPPRWHLPVTPLWVAALLCEMVVKPLGIEPPLYRRRVDFFRHDRAFDISKARREMGYVPRTDLQTGVRKTAQWYKQHGWLG